MVFESDFLCLGDVTVTSETGDRKVPGLTPNRGTVM